MVWSWSHTSEAYANVHTNVHNLPRKDLEVIYAEWKAAEEGHFKPNHCHFGQDFEEKRYQRALGRAKYLPTDVLADKVYELAERNSCCTNGGWEAYLCPYLCPVHTVSFDDEQHEEDDDATDV